MAEFDHGTKRIAEAAGRQLARIAGVDCVTWEPLESTLPITVELLADRAFLATRPDERFVVYFEFYTTWDTGAPWDILAKSALLSRREKLPTVCVVVVLQPEGAPAKKGQIRLEVAGKMVQFVRLEEVFLWDEKPEPTGAGKLLLHFLSKDLIRPPRNISFDSRVHPGSGGAVYRGIGCTGSLPFLTLRSPGCIRQRYTGRFGLPGVVDYGA